MLIDTHCHLTHERYAEDRLEVLTRAHSAGVGGVVGIASDLDDARGLHRFARTVAGSDGLEEGTAVSPVWTTVGIHPHQAETAPRDLRRRLDETLDEIPDAVAVGECGLDFHYDFSPRSAQRDVFRTHLDVARDRGLPVVVHCRDAEEEMAGIVAEAGRAGVFGVIHCFPGNLDLLEAAMGAGWYVSFTGLVTFRSFEGLEAVRRVPDDRYMLETDGPYMAPVPRRGRRNEPAWVPHIRDRVAEVRGEEPTIVETATTATARRFFSLETLTHESASS